MDKNFSLLEQPDYEFATIRVCYRHGFVLSLLNTDCIVPGLTVCILTNQENHLHMQIGSHELILSRYLNIVDLKGLVEDIDKTMR